MVRFPLLFAVFISLSTALFPLSTSKGTIDLRGEDFTRVYRLTGEWIFTDTSGNKSLRSAPDSWNDIYGTSLGKGSYSIRILLPEKIDKDLALFLPKYNQIVTVRSGDRILYGAEHPGKDSSGFIKDLIVWHESGEFILRIDLENFFYRKGGLHHAPYLGSYDSIIRYRNRLLLSQAFVVAILFFLFLFSFFLYLNKYFSLSSLALGMAALAFSLRGLMTGEILYEIYFPSIPWQIPYRADYVLLYLGGMFIIHHLFFYFEARDSHHGMTARLLEILGMAGALLSLILPLRLVSLGIFTVQFYGMAIFVNCLLLLARMVKKKNPEARIISIGAFLFLILAAVDIINTHGGHIIPNATQKGMLLFILSQFIVLTRRLVKAHRKSEMLSKELEQEVSRQTWELKKLSRTDPLTGIGNRRQFYELGEREAAIHNRYGHPLALMMLDLDHFKNINDQYGHSAGDNALIHMTRIIHQFIRDTDIFGRLGGEEFALLLLETPLARAKEAAQRIRRELQKSTENGERGIPPMTVSIGLVSLREGEPLADAMERADALMYEAKKSGRNRVVTEEISG